MHIVFVTTELATLNHSSGGLASFTANMARIFVKEGHKVTIILSSVKEEELVFDDEIVLEVTYINKKEKIDFIHYCNLGGLAFFVDKRIPYCIRVSGGPIWVGGRTCQRRG